MFYKSGSFSGAKKSYIIVGEDRNLVNFSVFDEDNNVEKLFVNLTYEDAQTKIEQEQKIIYNNITKWEDEFFEDDE